MDVRRSTRIASRRTRRGEAQRGSPVVRGTIRRRGRPRIVRVEENILVPPAIALELVSEEKSYNHGSNFDVSAGVHAEIPVQPVETNERVAPTTLVVNVEEFASSIARAIRESHEGGGAFGRRGEQDIMTI